MTLAIRKEREGGGEGGQTGGGSGQLGAFFRFWHIKYRIPWEKKGGKWLLARTRQNRGYAPT